jgi:uncharacterized MAPEG superfamily protein
MSVELKVLAWSICLGIVSVLVASSLGTAQRSLGWNLSNRDEETKPLTGAAARAHRANRNFLETFPFFAAAVLAVVLAKANSSHTALGAQLYFWARLAYVPIYIIGLPYVRTLVWGVAFAGLLMVLGALF